MRLSNRNDIGNTTAQRVFLWLKLLAIHAKLAQGIADKIAIVVHISNEIAGEHSREFRRPSEDHVCVAKHNEFIVARADFGGVNETARGVAWSVVIAVLIYAIAWRRIKGASGFRQIVEIRMPVISPVVNNYDWLVVHAGDAREVKELALPPDVSVVLGRHNYLMLARHVTKCLRSSIAAIRLSATLRAILYLSKPESAPGIGRLSGLLSHNHDHFALAPAVKFAKKDSLPSSQQQLAVFEW